MVASSTSILFFLSMFMSRYTEEDFFETIPSIFLIGLTALFVSIVSMMVIFCAACFLIYKSASPGLQFLQSLWLVPRLLLFYCYVLIFWRNRHKYISMYIFHSLLYYKCRIFFYQKMPIGGWLSRKYEMQVK
jgi:hypothetical protein